MKLLGADRWKTEDCYCGCGGTWSRQSVWRSGRRIELQIHTCERLPKPKTYYSCGWIELGVELGDASWAPEDIEEYVRRKLGPG